MMHGLRRAWREGFSPWRGLRDGPLVKDRGATDVDGLWIAGDLAGSPLLKSAMADGWDVGQAVADACDAAPPSHPTVIIGAGPAGMACARALQERGYPPVVLERAQAFATIDAFPAGKTIYAEPAGFDPPPHLWFQDGTKEALVARWRSDTADWALDLRPHTDVVDLTPSETGHTVHTASGDVVHASHVVLAVGRRGTPRTLDVPGAARARTQLEEASAHAEDVVVVVGGGDSAAEAACQLSKHAAHVHLVHRGSRLDRPNPRTVDALEAEVAAGRVTLHLQARVAEVRPAAVHLADGDTLPADAVYTMLGTIPPMPWLARFGVRARSAVPWTEVAWAAAFIAFVWCFYVLKYGKPWFPFGPNSASWVHSALAVPVPWYPTADGSVRVLDAGFWGTVLYSCAILAFGILAIRRYRSPVQTRRYLALIGFQWIFLFGIPEVLAPMVTTAAAQLYTISVPWPLSVASIAKSPTVPAAGLWIGIGAFIAFVVVPAFVRRHNERFCSYLCGCGGLAETVGDMWRWRAPRGDGARTSEAAGRVIFVAAAILTVLILADAWKLVGWQTYLDQDLVVSGDRVDIAAAAPREEEGQMRIAQATVQGSTLTLTIDKFNWDGVWRANGWTSGVQVGDRTVYPQKQDEGVYTLDLTSLPPNPTLTVGAGVSALTNVRVFAQGWYSLMVDFWLASFLGVAFYPLLGNRIWCRFFCPLRAYMEWIAARWGRLAIVADDTCIACGECTTYCQMGIDVQGFADKQRTLDNANSACIQCGICVEVCPMDVLTLVDKPTAGVAPGQTGQTGPRWGA